MFFRIGGKKRTLGKPSKLRFFPLLAATYFMVSGGPYDIEDIIGFGGYGWALVLLFVLPIFWSFPTALMLGELASSIPAEGGFYAWVRRALGPFWGFQEAWLSLSASVFDMAIYPTTFVLYLGHLAPSLTAGHRALFLELGVVAAAVFWNLRGAVAVGEGSLRLWVISISPYVVLVGLAIAAGFLGTRGPFGGHASMARPEGVSFSTAILVAMWNYMGWDNATTVANEVDNPQRTYPRMILFAVTMIMLTYAIPISAVAWAGIPASRFSTGAWVDAASMLGGPFLAAAVVIAGVIDDFGTFSNLTMSYTPPAPRACRRRFAPFSFHKTATQRIAVGRSPGLRTLLGARTRLHLRTPHHHRPRALGHVARARVSRPHCAAKTRAFSCAPIPRSGSGLVRCSSGPEPHRARHLCSLCLPV